MLRVWPYCGGRGNRRQAAGGITLELTGTQRHCAARRKLTSTLRGAMPLRVRVERVLIRAIEISAI
jgi:hypothetical protein